MSPGKCVNSAAPPPKTGCVKQFAVKFHSLNCEACEWPRTGEEANESAAKRAYKSDVTQ